MHKDAFDLVTLTVKMQVIMTWDLQPVSGEGKVKGPESSKSWLYDFHMPNASLGERGKNQLCTVIRGYINNYQDL